MPSYALPITLDETGFLSGGPLESMRVLNALINTAWTEADAKQTAFEAKMTAAQTTWLDDTAAPHVTAGQSTVPSITEPGVTIPSTVDAAAIYDEFNTQYLELVALLSDKFVAFRTAYFLDEGAAYSAAEDWLQGAVANSTGGIPAAVLTQVWEDDRTRILSEAGRASADVLATFAAKRFPLPPGAAAAAVVEINQKAQDEIAESSRKVAITSIENMKFAVTNLLNLRKIAMDSAVEYVKALASGPEMASRLVGVGYDAQSKLISAAASFYGARSTAAEVISKANQYNNSIELEADVKNQTADLTLIEDKLKALLAEASSIAEMAKALFNNLRANAGTDYNTHIGHTV